MANLGIMHSGVQQAIHHDHFWCSCAGIEPVRWVVGAGRGTRLNPPDLETFEPKVKRLRTNRRDYGGRNMSQGYYPPRTL